MPQEKETKYGKVMHPIAIKVGGLYEYDYLPDKQNRYPVYDPHPLMLCLLREGKYVGGINLHYLRNPLRKEFLNAAMEKMKGGFIVSENKSIPSGIVQAAYHLYKMENFKSPALMIDPSYYENRTKVSAKFVGPTAQKQYNTSDILIKDENSVLVRRSKEESGKWEIIGSHAIKNKKALRILQNNKTLSHERLRGIKTRYRVRIKRLA